LAYLPLGVFITIGLASLYSVAFRLGLTPPIVSLGLLAALITGVGIATRQFSISAAAGTRFTLGHISVVCLLGGVAAAPPVEFPELMLWSLAALAGAAAFILMIEAWLSEKIDAAGPFSRHLGRQVNGLFILSAAVLLWRSGRVDGWVIAVGAIHYILLIASVAVPALRHDSPVIWRPYARFASGVILSAALAPIVPSILASGLGIMALGLVVAVAAADADLIKS
jgi:hypothetical protein